MRGVIGLSVFNVLIVGIIALVAVWLFNSFAAGKTIFGMTLGRA